MLKNQLNSSNENLFELVNGINNQSKKRKHTDESPQISKEEIDYNLTKEIEEQQAHYKNTEKSDPTRLYILGILFVQLCLASLRAPLYLRIHSQPLVRAAWRQGFIAVIYIPISVYDMSQSGGQGIDFTAKYKDLVAAFIAQSVFVASLSISITYTHISFVLMFYNSSLLIYCVYKIVLNISTSPHEYIGLAVSILLLSFIVANHTFKAKTGVTSFEEIIFGDMLALLGGGVCTLTSAFYYSRIQFCAPRYTIFCLIRIGSTLILVVATLLFEPDSNLADFLQPLLFTEIFLNALFTGVLMHILQSYVERLLDPISYNSAHFFQPLLGSFFSYLLGLEPLPSYQMALLMLLFSCGMIIIQIGRTQNEIDDFKFEGIELRKLDTVILENALISRLDDKSAAKERQSLYRRKTIQRRNTKTIIDYSMDQ